jgi:hypothetical protein
MAWTDFYMQTTGNNLNAGSTNADSAVYTSTSGNWDGTSVFTPTDGQTTTSLVNVNDWCSIYPTGNTTTPYVAQVTAVGAGTNGTITLSTTAKFGSAPASNNGSRNAKIGGAWADLGMLASGAALNTGTVNSSTRINVKAGTYANTTTNRTFAMLGTTSAPLWWRGYKTSIGDQDTNNTATAGTDIPSITFTTGQLTIGTGNQYQIFSNIDFTGATVAANGLVSLSGTYNVFYGCRFTNTATNANSAAITLTSTGNACFFTRCWFKATTTATRCIYNNQATFTTWRGCTITNGVAGFETASASASNVLSGVVIDSPAGDGIKIGGSAWIESCSIYNPTGNGINIATVSGNGVMIANCYISTVTQASKYGINNTTGTNTLLIRCVGNAFFNCSNGNTNGLTETFLMLDNGTLGSEGFQTPGSQDFSMKLVGQAIGSPGGFENVSLYKSYTDVGALQHLATGGPTGQIMRVTGQHYQAN